MTKPRQPATPFTRHVKIRGGDITGTNCKNVASISKAIKAAHRKAGRHESLKEFVKNSQDPVVLELKDQWFHNKTANFSNPPLGIGSTKKKKTKQGQKKADPTV